MLSLFCALCLFSFSQKRVEAATPHATNVCGPIIHNTTWTLANSPYIMTCDVSIANNVTLTIEPGVVVKADSADDDLHLYGTLVMDGSNVSPIVFTSYRDDSYGGDSNGDGGATSPAAGDWGGIYFHAGSFNNVIDNCLMAYGGSNAAQGAAANLRTDNVDLTITNCTFRNSASHGVSGNGVSGSVAMVVNGNSFQNNGAAGFYGLGSNGSASFTLQNNSFQNNAAAGRLLMNNASGGIDLSGNSTSNNGVNGVELSGGVSGLFTVNAGTPANLPIVVTSDFTVSETGTLDLMPGAIIKGSSSSSDLHVFGVLNANGTDTNPITFTSIHDDSNGGDTNNNGAATSPAAGNWGGIYIHSDSVSSVFNECAIAYGGSNAVNSPGRNLLIDNTDFTMTNCTSSYSADAGLYAVASTAPISITVSNNSFENNSTQGVGFFMDGQDINATLESNDFDGNDAAVGATLDAGGGELVLDGNTADNNNINGVSLLGGTSTSFTVDTLAQNNFAVVLSDDFVVNVGGTLTFSPNSVIKGHNSNVNLHVYGTLNAAGTPSLGITFTSFKDDAYAGDTNDDNNATVAVNGDWGGISIYDGSNSNLLNRCVIAYGGSNTAAIGNANVRVTNADLNMTFCTVRNSASDGLNMSYTGVLRAPVATSTLQNNAFRNNISDGVEVVATGSNVNLSWLTNSFQSNVRAATLSLVDASGSITLNGNTLSNNATNGIAVAGSIAGSFNIDSTSQTNFPFVLVDDLVVSTGATLTLSTDTIFKGSHPDRDLHNFGTLVASGTSTDPILFTSLRDDTIGGDTNNNGNANQPFSGEWGGIILHGDSLSSLSNITIAYGGSDSADGANANLQIANTTAVVSNCIIRQSAHDGINILNTTANADVVVQGCAIRNNVQYGIYAGISNVNSDLVFNTNVIENNLNKAIGVDLVNAAGSVSLTNNSVNNNGMDGVGIKGIVSGSFTLNSLSQTNFPFILNDDLIVPAGSSLTLTPNTIIKTTAAGYGITVLGTILADGIPSQPIVFTSLKNDSVGGDTNNDGAATVPAAGDWSGIYLETTATGTFDNCVVNYGGAPDPTGANANIRSKAINFSIKRCTISNSAQDGLALNNSSASPTVLLNSIVNNGSYGLFNGGTNVVNARNNWWGSNTGPYHPTFNPSGTGSEISNNVGFQPWLQASDISSVIDYNFTWNGGSSGSNSFVLYSSGSFVDLSGNGGVWQFQAANNLLYLSYQTGPACMPLYVGTYQTATTLAGQMFCRNGSGGSGTWTGTVAN